MAREIAISRFGPPEVLELRQVPDSPPRAGELRIRQTAVGVNFTDVHGRRGDYAPLRALPMPLVLLSSPYAPTASVLPSLLRATEVPNWSFAPVFEAFT